MISLCFSNIITEYKENTFRNLSALQEDRNANKLIQCDVLIIGIYIKSIEKGWLKASQYRKGNAGA